MELRRVQYAGTWFAVEGRKDRVHSATDEKIQAACKRIFDSIASPAQPSASTPQAVASGAAAIPPALQRKETVEEGVTVRLLGSRTVTPLQAPQSEAKTHSILWQLLSGLCTLVARLFGRKKTDPEEEVKLEMQLAMQLFATEDAELLDAASSRQDIAKLPFSKVLGLWTRTLREAHTGDSELEQKLNALDKLPSYQKALETIRTLSSQSKREAARAKLLGQIQADLNEAKGSGAPVYVPGGLWDAEHEKELPVFYEFTWDKVNNQWNVRTLDPTGKAFEALSEEQTPQETDSPPAGEEEASAQKLERERQEALTHFTSLLEPKAKAHEAPFLEGHTEIKDSQVSSFLRTTLLLGSRPEKLPKKAPGLFGFIKLLIQSKNEPTENEWETFSKTQRVTAEKAQDLLILRIFKKAGLILDMPMEMPPRAHDESFDLVENEEDVGIQTPGAGVPHFEQADVLRMLDGDLPLYENHPELKDRLKKEVEEIYARPLRTVVLPGGQEAIGFRATSESRASKQVDPSRYSRLFIRSVFGREYTSQITLQRAHTFLSLWEKAPEVKIRDPHFRSWMVENGKKLLHSMEKLPRHMEAGTVVLKAQIGSIIDQIEQFDQIQRSLLPDEASRRIAGSEISAPLRPDTSLVSMGSIERRSVSSLSLETPNIESMLQGDSIRAFQEHVHQLERLADRGDFSRLHAQLSTTFLALQAHFTTPESISSLANGPDRDSWIASLKNLSFLLVRSSFGQNRTTPMPEDIFAYLFSMKLQDQLIRASRDLQGDHYVQRFCLDMQPVKRILGDPYICSSGSVRGIQECINYFEGLRKVPIRGFYCGERPQWGSSESEIAYSHDEDLFGRYAREKGKTVDEAAQEISESHIVPQHILELRQSSMLFEAFLSPTRVMVPCAALDMYGVGKEALGQAAESGASDLLEAGGRLGYQIMSKKVLQFACQRRGAISFSKPEYSRALHRHVVFVQPWNMALVHSDDEMGFSNLGSRLDFEHRASFDRRGVAIEDSALREHCFEQTVAERALKGKEQESLAFDDAGEVIDDPHRNPSLHGRTEWQILQDLTQIVGLSSRTSQDMQLMQTGQGTIIQNTLSFLSRNTALLDQPAYGAQIARLVERSFIRNGLFFRADAATQNLALETLMSQMENALITENPSAALHLFRIADGLFRGAKEEVRRHHQEKFQTLIDTLFSPRFEEAAAAKKGLRELFLTRLFVLEKRKPLDAENIAKTFFQLNSEPSTMRTVDPSREEHVRELYYRIAPSIQKTPDLCDSIATLFGKEGKFAKGQWKAVDRERYVFQNGSITIDFSRAEVWENGERRGLLPSAVTDHPLFDRMRELIHEAANQEWKATPVRLPMEGKKGETMEGVLYETQQEGILFRLLFATDGTIRLYRKREGEKKWFQFQHDLFSGNPPSGWSEADLKKVGGHVPRILQEGDCWIREDGKELLVEEQGITTWKARLSGPEKLQIRSLERVATAREGTVRPIEEAPQFHHFLDVETASRVTALSNPGSDQVGRVEFSRFDKPYSFRYDSGRWRSEQYSDYYLSEKSLERYAQPQVSDPETSVNPTTQSTFSRLQRFFHPSFTNYHLLESTRNRPALLVLSGVQYDRQQVGSGKSLSYRFHPRYEDDISDRLMQYTFEIDPVKGLIAKQQPEGYLYLAYTLMIQGNTKDAFYYLQKANLQRPTTVLGNDILQWMKKYLDRQPATNPEICLLKARLFLLEIHAEGKKIDLSRPEGHMKALQAKNLYDQARSSFSGEMTLTAEEKREFEELSFSSWLAIGHTIAQDRQKWEITHQASELMKSFTQEGLSQEETLERLQETLDKPAWKKFKTDVLTPFHISLKELMELHEAGLLDKLLDFQSTESFMTAAIQASDIRQRHVLESEIQSLRRDLEAIPPPSAPPQAKGEVSLFSETERSAWQGFFAESTSAREAPATTRLTAEAVTQFSTRPSDGTYAGSINEGLRSDLVDHIGLSPDFDSSFRAAVGRDEPGTEARPFSSSFVLPLARKEGLSRQLTEQVSEKTARTAQLRADILAKVRLSQAALTLEERMRRVGRQESDQLFDTLIRCYGEGNWSMLERLGISLSESARRELLPLLKEYLKTAIQTRQLQSALLLLQDFPAQEGSESHQKKSREVYDLLHTSWQYNVDAHPHAASFLLIEYELGFVCRASQVHVIEENLQRDNCFKQEICGGGKTTVLRNIISQIRADGKTLSGVSTLTPLRGEHGLLYARTTKNAFGEMVYDFRFDRTTATDVVSLLKIEHDLLATTQARGRIDLSKGDVQSFRLSQHLKLDELQKKRQEQAQEGISEDRREQLEKEIEALHDEIDVMEDIRDFLKEHTVIMADELDKDCDPTQEKNYANGRLQEVNPVKRKACLSIMNLFLKGTSPHLQSIRQAQQTIPPTKLSEDQIHNALTAVADELYQEFIDLGLTKEEFIDYLTNPASESARETYSFLYDQFTPPTAPPMPELLQKLAYLRQFLSEIAPHALTKMNGVSYGRSHDGVSVIPYAGSAKPKEGSLHGNDMERLWYTAMNYLQEGVRPEQARALWIAAHEKAIEEVLQARKLGRSLAIDDTPSAREFQEKILHYAGDPPPTLSQVTEETMSAICNALQQNPDALLQFIEENVFDKIKQSEEKITSDAQDLPHMMKSYSGSSGTDTGKDALPDSIDISDVRQPGVHGEITRSLLESEQRVSQGSFLEQAPTLDGQFAQLAREMRWGDCLSDVGRHFPNIEAKTMAEQLMAQLKQQGNIPEGSEPYYVLFIDESDRWQMLRDDGEVVPYDPASDCGRKITIFDDVHTRGSERTSKAGVTEFVTLDLDTDWSRFEQAVMRERGVTKGKAEVRYILTPALQQKLAELGQGEPPTFDTLLDVLTHNEARQLQEMNYKAERQRIKHILKRTGEQALRDISRASRRRGLHTHHRIREKAFATMRQLYFLSNKADVLSAAAPQGMRKTTEVLSDLLDSQLRLLDSFEAAIRDDHDIQSVRTPTRLQDVQSDFLTMTQEIDRLLEAHQHMKKALDDLERDCQDPQKPHMRPLKEKVSALQREMNSSKTQESLQTLIKTKDRIQRQLKTLEKSTQLEEELGQDLLGPIQEQIREQRSTMQDLLSSQRQIAKQTHEWQQSWEAPGGSVFQRVRNRVLKEHFSPLFLAFDSLHEASQSLDSTLEKIETKGERLVEIFEHSMDEARVDLDNEREKLEEEEFTRCLPEMVMQGAQESGSEEEVETEQEQEMETETAAEAQEEAAGGETYAYLTLDSLSILIRSVERQGSAHNLHSMQKYNPLLPPGKYFTENCYPVDRSQETLRPWGPDVKALPPYRPLRRSLFVINKETGKVREIFGSQLDNERTFADGIRDLQHNTRYQVCMYNYELSRVDQGVNFERLPAPQAKQVMSMIVSSMVQRGDVSFASFPSDGTTSALILKDYKGALIEYLKTLGPREALLAFEESIKTMIASQRKDVTYAGSDLADAFRQAKEVIRE